MLFYRPGQKHIAMRELMGQQSTENGGLIPISWIDQLHASEIDVQDRPRCIYLGIDPGGGGPGELGVIGLIETLHPEYGTRLAVSFCFLCLCFFYWPKISASMFVMRGKYSRRP